MIGFFCCENKSNLIFVALFGLGVVLIKWTLLSFLSKQLLSSPMLLDPTLQEESVSESEESYLERLALFFSFLL